MEYKIVNRESGEILVSGTIENADEIEELIPDVGNVQVIMGWEDVTNMIFQKIQDLLEEGVSDISIEKE